MTDTSVFTHLARAGHLDILEHLSPGGVLLVPDVVDTEIQRGREGYSGIPDTASLPWVELAVLDHEEESTLAVVKAALGGTSREHLGECAVIAVAKHRSCVAVLDDRPARAQARVHGVTCRTTLWLVVEAHKRLPSYDRDATIDAVDALIATGMRLPLHNGTEIITHAYRQGWLPEEED
ncbi:hypothetical protein [Salana multivorans]